MVCSTGLAGANYEIHNNHHQVSLLDKEAEAAHALLEDLEVTMLREAEELERDSARSTRGIPSGLRSRRSKIRD